MGIRELAGRVRSLSLLRSVIAVYGVMYMAIGAAWVITDSYSRMAVLSWIAGPYAGEIFGAGWIIVGLAAVVGTVAVSGSRAETIAGMACFTWSLFIGTIFLLVSVTTLMHTAWVQSITYYGIAAVIFLVSSHPDAVHTRPMREVS